MSNSWLASGSSFAWSALSYERVIPQVNGSLRMNFIAFGFGVPSISAIFGILGVAHRRVHWIAIRFGRSDGNGIQRGVQRVPRQDRALDACRQVAHARKYGEPAEVMRLVFDL